MAAEPSVPLDAAFQRFALASAGTSVLLGAAALLGWAAGVPLLRRGLAEAADMNPLTAASLVLLGASLAAAVQGRGGAAAAGRAAAAVTAGVAAARLAAAAAGRDFPPDALMPNRMPVNAALALAALGTGLALLDSPRPAGRFLARSLTVVGGLLAAAALLGYLYSVPAFYSAGPSTAMALPAALALLALSLGTHCSRPQAGLAAILSADDAGGLAARRLVPLVILVPAVLGWLRLVGQSRGLFGTELGTALFVVAMTTLMASVALHTSRRLSETDAQRTLAFRDRIAYAERLEAANRELETFSYSVSHDLRAPLRHVDGFIGLLRAHAGPKLDEKASHYMDTISTAAKRMGALIDDLLAFSKVGRDPMNCTGVALDALAAEVSRELAPEAAGRLVQWRIAPLAAARGDRALLKLAFANLLGNALKFTRGRDPAVISVVPHPAEPGETAFVVADNGAGFDPRYASRLFGVFERLHAQEEFEGTGIGLANVKRIVLRHGGRVWAEGEPGVGARFFVALPAEKTA